VALSTYKATLSFPRQETYGLVSQLRRAASSVPANIAEGCGCDGNRELARFLEIAFRSASETEYHLLLARDLGYLEINPTKSSILRGPRSVGGTLTLPLAKGMLRSLGTPARGSPQQAGGIEF